VSIEVKNLTVKANGKTIINNVTATFEEGKITVILGPNGCGKTTLVKEIVRRNSDNNKIAYVAQETTGFLNLEVQDVVELGRYDGKKYFAGVSSEDKSIVEDAMKAMEVDNKKDQLFDTLSGGEKQRVMMARALAQKSQWMILDEPTSSLDCPHVRAINDAVKNTKQAVVVMHDINEAVRLGENFVLMKDGKIIATVNKLTKELLEETFDAEFEELKSKDGKQIFFLK